jgi:hypothetical protein
VAHQHHCSGAQKTLFTASQWDADGNLMEARHCWIERDEALIARRAADLQLEQAAAAEHARTTQAIGFGIVAVLLAGGWIYTKVYSVGPDVLGKIAADVRKGIPGVQALTDNLAPRMYPKVQHAAKLATELKDA